MGNTLRGLLLYGYAFATIGTIAGIGAIVAFAGAGGPCCSSSLWASGTHAAPSTLSGTSSRREWLSTPEQGQTASRVPAGTREVCSVSPEGPTRR